MEITESKLKDILTEQRVAFREETHNLLGIMKEDFDSKVQLIAEQYQNIESTLNSHTEMIGSLSEDMQIVKSDVDFIKGSLRKKVDYDGSSALEKRVTLLEEKAKK